MESLRDVIDRLKYDRGCWSTVIQPRCWPEPIEVWMFSDEDGPTSYQQTVLQAILNHPVDIKSLIERPAFEFCRDFTGETFLALNDNADLVEFVFPALDRPTDIWELLEIPRIEIDDIGPPGQIHFAVGFHCRWDIEHGLQARFNNFALVDITI